MIPLGSGAVPATSSATMSLQLDPRFNSPGTTYAFQALVWDGTSIGLSTPAHATIRQD